MCRDEVLLESKLSLPLVGGIPCKGRVLNQMSLFWFEFLRDVVPSHVVTADIKRYPKMAARRKTMRGRSMQVKKADMVRVECVARGYLAGSAYREYCLQGKVCGIPLPPGLRDGDQLPEPIFTPATKAITGHDVNVPFRYIANVLGVELAGQLVKLIDRRLGETVYAEAVQGKGDSMPSAGPDKE